MVVEEASTAVGLPAPGAKYRAVGLGRACEQTLRHVLADILRPFACEIAEGDEQHAVPCAQDLVVGARAGSFGPRVEEGESEFLFGLSSEPFRGSEREHAAAALLEISGFGDRPASARQRTILLAERSLDFCRVPDVECALLLVPRAVVGVGIEGGPDAAARVEHLPLEPFQSQQDHTLVQGRISDYLAQRAGVDRQQERIVVEHLLEVRHGPLRIDAVAMPAAAKVVEQTSLGHVAQRHLDRVLRLLGAIPEQALQFHRVRELGCATESAVLRIEQFQRVLHGSHGDRPDQFL